MENNLAELYQVEPRTLNQSVKRNIESFPIDFMFELTDDETNELITKYDNLQNFDIIKRLEKLETNDKETR